jgi:hypothetical protein
LICISALFIAIFSFHGGHITKSASSIAPTDVGWFDDWGNIGLLLLLLLH